MALSEEQLRELREEWDRERQFTPAKNKRFLDWALTQEPELSEEDWEKALAKEAGNERS